VNYPDIGCVYKETYFSFRCAEFECGSGRRWLRKFNDDHPLNLANRANTAMELRIRGFELNKNIQFSSVYMETAGILLYPSIKG
jgi:hypothetical protein